MEPKKLSVEDLDVYKAMMDAFRNKYEIEGQFWIHPDTGVIMEIIATPAPTGRTIPSNIKKTYEEGRAKYREAMKEGERIRREAEEMRKKAEIEKREAEAKAKKNLPDDVVNKVIAMLPNGNMLS